MRDGVVRASGKMPVNTTLYGAVPFQSLQGPGHQAIDGQIFRCEGSFRYQDSFRGNDIQGSNTIAAVCSRSTPASHVGEFSCTINLYMDSLNSGILCKRSRKP